MIAELKVYGDPSSPEPTKTYTVYRLTPHTMGAVQDFLFKKFNKEELADNKAVEKKYASATNEEVMEDMVRLLQIFFPAITDEEVEKLDFGDHSGNNGQFYEFVNAINAYANNESNRSLKN